MSKATKRLSVTTSRLAKELCMPASHAKSLPGDVLLWKVPDTEDHVQSEQAMALAVSANRLPDIFACHPAAFKRCSRAQRVLP